MKSKNLTPFQRRILWLILWGVLCVVGFALESWGLWSLAVYIPLTLLVFLFAIRQGRQPDTDRGVLGCIGEAFCLWLVPLSRIVILFIQQP